MVEQWTLLIVTQAESVMGWTVVLGVGQCTVGHLKYRQRNIHGVVEKLEVRCAGPMDTFNIDTGIKYHWVDCWVRHWLVYTWTLEISAEKYTWVCWEV